MPRGGPNSERVLVLAARRRDAELAGQIIAEAGFFPVSCPGSATLTQELTKGAGCAVITEEAIDDAAVGLLYRWIGDQPTWSDLPIIVLTARLEEAPRCRTGRQLQHELGNISFLERPFHPQTLQSMVRAAMRSRRRQYEARELLERYRLLARELQHRTKNLLAVIMSIAGANLRRGGDGQDAFISRLHALASAQDLLMEGSGHGAFLSDIVSTITRSFGERIVIDGPRVHLSPTLAQGFALIVHELVTNAAKHGALGAEGGRINVRWAVNDATADHYLVFRWQETGGPRVLPPTRKSFGTILLERAVPAAGAAPRFHYGADGFAYELSVDLKK